MLLHKSPMDYGIDSYQWAADWIGEVIERKWGIQISDSCLYRLSDQWGLSLQKAHRDYGAIRLHLSLT